MKSANFWIKELGLIPLPEEGGLYKEIYRSDEVIPASALPERFGGNRTYSTSIYYLLQHPEFSAFHKINQDEIWHFYDGSPLTIHIIDNNGKYFTRKLGRELEKGEELQVVICAGWLFAAETEIDSYSLIGCTVAPGFEFEDFQLPTREELLSNFPEHTNVIHRFTRK
jgi:predicted cupin superfamily sugar epimerase